ncbi:hypothetical protein AB4Z45_12585 [Paenibacillus sp. MCAF9]|uniref:hypothetical protein n=1 Tax=Paenibacillus sp. MCAF9 TaxID=3233046 RepID=UPI003F966DCD
MAGPVIRQLLIRAGADFSALRREMQSAKNDIDKFKSGLKAAVAGIATILAGIGLGSAMNDAIKFEALMGTISKTLGRSAEDFVKWQQTVGDAMGFSKLETAEMANNYSLRLKSIAKDEQDLLKKTTDLIKAAAIIRSKTGMSSIEISDRMRSAMNQEADGADELGVNVRVSAIQQSNAYKMLANNAPWDSMSESLKKTILYQHILESTTANFGTEIAQNTALLKGGFIAALNDTKLALGQAFLPILNIALPLLTRMARAAEWAFQRFSMLMRALFPKSNIASGAATTSMIDKQMSSVEGLGAAQDAAGKAAKKAGKAAKEAASNIQGFDELHQIQEPKAAAGDSATSDPAGAVGGVAGGGMGDIGEFDATTMDISPKIQAVADKIRAAFAWMRDGIKTAFGETSAFVTEHKEIIIAALSGLAAGIATFFIAINWASWVAAIQKALAALRVALLAVFGTISLPVLLIAAAVAALVAAFVYFYRTNEKFRGVVDGILQKIGDVAKWLWQEVLVPLGKFLGEQLVDGWERVTKAATWFWNNVLVPLGNFLKEFYSSVIKPLAALLSDVFAFAFDKVSKVAKIFWENVLVPLGNFLSATFKPLIEAISAVFTFLWKYAIQPLAEYVGGKFLKVWQNIVAVLKVLWDVVKPVGDYMFEKFAPILEEAFGKIGEAIGKAQNIFVNLLNFITKTFTGDWENSWEAVSAVFGRIFGAIGDAAKAPLNMIIDMINEVISGMNKITTVEIGGKQVGIKIPKIPRLARGGVVDRKTNMGNFIGGEAGAELIVPLENTSFTDKIAAAIGTAVMTAVSMGQGQGKGDTIIQIDGREIARTVQPYSASEAKRIGGSMIVTT